MTKITQTAWASRSRDKITTRLGRAVIASLTDRREINFYRQIKPKKSWWNALTLAESGVTLGVSSEVG